jgi:hypothetical protein
MPSRFCTYLVTSLLPLLTTGVAFAGPCPVGDRSGGCIDHAPLILAWRDQGEQYPYRDGYGPPQGGYYPPPRAYEPPRRGPLPPQAYPGGVRPTCAKGTHLEGWDCVRDPSGPAIIDQQREGCPRDYHTNRKGTKCIRDGYED